MRTLQVSLIGAAVIAGVVASLAIRGRTQTELRQKDAAARQQDQQLAGLAAEHERLSNLVAQSAGAPAKEPAAELEKLRVQAAGLRAQKDNLEKQVEEKRRSRQAGSTPYQAPHPPEYYQELLRLSAGKTSDGKILGIAFAMYALDHDGRFPSTLDEAATYCGKEDMKLTGTNQFEILFNGSTGDLKVPRGEVIVCRDRQTFLAPSGKLARIYVTADTAVQIIESDDNFQAYEAAHMISR
jgi:hypothetical protein